jgi:hypothetical protein
MAKIAPARTFKLLPALVLVALVVPSSAFGQATRTWVSGVGDDVNPCSRTAPCKTFAGAISKTAAGGIIMAMDDGGFGTLTITKPITVDGGHHSAGMLASGGINGVNININPATQPANFVNNGRVVLRNLKIEGNTSIPSAGGFTLGLNGVRITNGRNLKIVNSDIGFFSRSAVSIEPDASQSTKVVIVDSNLHDNGGSGVNVAPKNAAIAKVTLRRNDIDDNACGVSALTFGMDSGFNFNGDCAAASSASGVLGTATISAYDNGISDNSASGILSRGSQATVRIANNNITRNVVGLRAFDGGSILSFGGNLLADNNTNGAPTGSAGAPVKQVVPKH